MSFVCRIDSNMESTQCVNRNSSVLPVAALATQVMSETCRLTDTNGSTVQKYAQTI